LLTVNKELQVLTLYVKQALDQHRGDQCRY
jgi:hypothetical protein